MEVKLSVSIGATLQVKNARGEWDWIKPEVGCEISMNKNEVGSPEVLSDQFAAMWDQVVGPQFASVVQELIAEQSPKTEETVEETANDVSVEEDLIEEEKPNTDEDDYY